MFEPQSLSQGIGVLVLGGGLLAIIRIIGEKLNLKVDEHKDEKVRGAYV